MSNEKQPAHNEHHDHEHESEHRNRLPTLLEVLSRRTLPPVDLYSFYIYMRDQQQSVDYLDFWLDVTQHMSLCRLYVRQLRRSVLMGTPEPSLRANTMLDVDHDDGTSSRESSEQQSKRVSAVLRAENRSEHSLPRSNRNSNNSSNAGNRNSNNSSNAGNRNSNRNSNNSSSVGNRNSNTTSNLGQDSELSGENDSSFHRLQERGGVSRADLRASAERILYTYLLPSSEREVVLPENLIEEVLHMIEVEQRDDPEVFDATKDYVFQAMERDAFPGFLESKALGNLVPSSIFIRLILALVCFFGGFWAAFYNVLSDQSRRTRCWVILPFFFAAYFVASYQYRLDPIAALLGYSEYTFMNWTKAREPFVRSLLFKRAWANFIIVAATAVSLSVLFIFVPGKHI